MELIVKRSYRITVEGFSFGIIAERGIADSFLDTVTRMADAGDLMGRLYFLEEYEYDEEKREYVPGWTDSRPVKPTLDVRYEVEEVDLEVE